MKGWRWVHLLIAVFVEGSLLAGCGVKSYPSEKIRDSLIEICRKEYGIQELEVKIVGSTIGVYLPLKKLFAADFKEAAESGKVRNFETLFEPSPEALEKVEDVLFSISRVILSTDKPLQFYVLQATDVEMTGAQLVLTGFVDDIKRVRIWDISRNEYRKRVVHELRLNRAVVWGGPVRDFFKDLENLTLRDIRKKYFTEGLPEGAIQTLFFNAISPDSRNLGKTRWKILELRANQIRKNEALVYGKVQPHIEGKTVKGKSAPLQYLFILGLHGETARILRIVPFQYLDAQSQMQKVQFPKELDQIESNVEQWEQEFHVEEIRLGPFLAQQLTRRAQALVGADERIRNTFRQVQLVFEYHENTEEPPHFSLNVEAALQDTEAYGYDSLVFHEDMLYLLNLASREFVDLVRSYQFGGYDYLSLNLAPEPDAWILGREDLELFRRKKIDLQGLLTVPKI